VKRVLFVTPHFPPDASAGAHRARVLAPHLERAGWRPTVLTVEPEAYGGVLDHELAAMLPPDLDVVRAPAWRAAASRRVGFGDLGLRSLTGLWRAARALTASTHFDAVYLTTYPV
jgi:aminoglycoside phosphotransferase (APT) family kinase protein